MPPFDSALSPEEHQRFVRQVALKEFGVIGQQKLKSARVLIIGLGGLGLPAAQVLNGMGVGQLGLVDGDRVELHNLHRQSLYREQDLGRLKVEAALSLLEERNSLTGITTHANYVAVDSIKELISSYDVVLDCTDNFPTRYLINDTCVIHNKPFVYGALQGFQGQLAVFNYKGSATYRCLFAHPPKEGEIPSCNENGILGTVPFMIGSAQAMEAVKIICDLPGILSNTLLMTDFLHHRQTKMRFKPRSKNFEITSLKADYGYHCTLDPQWIRSWATYFENISEQVQLIDIREKEEGQGEIVAQSIPFSTFKSQAPKWDPNQRYFLFCKSGRRSERAVQELREQLPEFSFFSIRGGIDALPEQKGSYS